MKRGASPVPAGVKKARLIQAYLRGRPIACTWQLSRHCQSQCLYCDHYLESCAQEGTPAASQRVVERLNELGSLIVSLTGADPLMEPDLPGVVAALAQRHFVFMTSHGWPMTPSKARALWEAGLEGISLRLHGAEPAQHDAAAGVPGAHGRVMEALAALNDTRERRAQRINLKLQLSPQNLDQIEGLLVLAARQDATVTVEPPAVMASPSGPPLAGIAERLVRLKARYSNFRCSTRFLKKLDQALAGGVPNCRAGRAFFNVDWRGRVSPCLECQRPEDFAGDLTAEGSIDAILQRLGRLAKLKDCRNCWHSWRGEIESLYAWRGIFALVPRLLRP